MWQNIALEPLIKLAVLGYNGWVCFVQVTKLPISVLAT